MSTFVENYSGQISATSNRMLFLNQKYSIVVAAAADVVRDLRRVFRQVEVEDER